MSPPEATESSAVVNGDLILLDYELWAELGDRVDLIDTTREEVAQKANLKIPEGHTFGPYPHIVGGEHFPGSIESFLLTLPLGREVEKEFAPSDAFGERDPKLIELFSMHEIERLPEMRKENAELDVGTVLTIRGRTGRVVSLTAARVRVDFNRPFAGRKVKGKFRIVSKVTDPVEKARAVVELTYGRSKEFGVEVHQDHVVLKVPDRTKFDFAWMASKPRVIDQLRSQLKPTSIKIVEEYLTPAKERKETAPKEGSTSEEMEPDSSAEAAPSEPPLSRKTSHAHRESKPAGSPAASE
jgi:FKBP-type peptidyl-prolyl cis-trans isomerase 2